MRKILAVLLASMLFFVAHHAHAASVGGILGTAEEVGVFASTHALGPVSFDAAATTRTIDGGITGHLPLSYNLQALLVGSAGWLHGMRDNIQGVHYGFKGGLGYVNGVDVRLTGGVNIEGKNVGPAFSLSVGAVF